MHEIGIQTIETKDSSTQTDFIVSKKEEERVRFYNFRYLKHIYNTIDGNNYVRYYTYIPDSEKPWVHENNFYKTLNECATEMVNVYGNRRSLNVYDDTICYLDNNEWISINNLRR